MQLSEKQIKIESEITNVARQLQGKTLYQVRDYIRKHNIQIPTDVEKSTDRGLMIENMIQQTRTHPLQERL